MSTVSANGGQPVRQDYVLPRVIRYLCLCAGMLVAYSQFVSVVFLFMYRAQDAWVPGRGYVTNRGFMDKFLVQSIWLEGGDIGYLRYPAWLTVSIGAALAILGSAGLFAAGRARRNWCGGRILLTLGAVAGIGVAGVVYRIHLFEGISLLNMFGFEITNLYFLHGKTEFFGATVLPAVTCSVLILIMFGAATSARILAWRDRSS